MPKQVSTPLTKRFRLEGFDPDGDSYVVIAQARQREQEAHDNLYSETTRIWNDKVSGGEMRLMQRVSAGEVVRTEIFLTLIDCNLLDENGQPLFKFGVRPDGRTGLLMDTNAFAVALGKCDTDLVDEIHGCVREVNAQWGPLGRLPKQEDASESKTQPSPEKAG